MKMKLIDVLPKIAGNVKIYEGIDSKKKLLLKSESVLEEKLFRIIPCGKCFSFLMYSAISWRCTRSFCCLLQQRIQ